MKRLRRILIGVNLTIVLATGIALVSPYTDPAANKVPAMFSLVFPFLVLANAVFLAGWLLAKHYAALLPLAAILLSWNAISGFVGFNPGDRSIAGDFQIASFNARHLYHTPDEPDRLNYLQDLIKRMGEPEIICVQEGGQMDKYASRLGYPHVARIKGSRNMLLSRFQVIHREKINMDPDDSYSGYYDIIAGEDTVRVFLIYLTSNRITEKSEELFSDPQIQNRETWKDGLGLVRSYVHKARIRARQSRKIRAAMDNSPYPVVAGGDLNDIPLSYAAHTIANEQQDAFRVKGSGLGTTYAGSIPGLRIDYVFASQEIEVLDYRTIRADASDHYPVVASVRIKDL